MPSDVDLLISDAQVHIWGEAQSAEPGAVGGSRRVLTADQILAEMDAAGVAHAILVPPAAVGDDNTAALEAASRFPSRFAVMGRLPVNGLVTRDDLSRWRDQPGMLGVRLTFTKPHVRAWLEDGTADWFWPLAEEFSLPIMVACGHNVAALERILTRHPGLRLVIDHLGLETADRDAALEEAVERLLPLHRHEGLALKASAVPTYLSHAYPLPQALSHVARVVDAFGARRVFWGSDLSRLDMPYRQLVEVFVDELPVSADDLDLVMGRGLRDWLRWVPSRL